MNRKETNVINIGGGAGCGKSVLAADVYSAISKIGLSVELVREYHKTWAITGRSIGRWDDVYIFAKHLKAEADLHGHVEWIVTDRPAWSSIVYERFFKGPTTLEPIVREIRRQQAAEGVWFHDFIVERTFPYVPDGRYQTELQALEVDRICREVMPQATMVKSARDILDMVGLGALYGTI